MAPHENNESLRYASSSQISTDEVSRTMTNTSVNSSLLLVESSSTATSSPAGTATGDGHTTSASTEGALDPVAKAKVIKPPSELQIKKLPSVEEIRKMIPEGGLDIRDLARKLEINDTNYWLFSELVKVMCDVGIRTWVKLLPTVPSSSTVEKLYESARKPAARRELLEDQIIAAELQGDIVITWDAHTELARGASNILPESFYRVFYEDSATLTPYVSKHTHPKHRGRLGLRISDEVAFESIGRFSLSKDLTRNRIERHLVWNQKKDPSSFISVSNSINVAEKRAIFHSPAGKSNRIGERIAIARISTHGLRPITIHADLKETIQKRSKDMDGVDTFEDISNEIRPVQIPAWVHEDALSDYNDDASISLGDFEAAHPEIWVSITELRHSNLKVPAARGHDYEWLAAGKILKKRIRKIMPYDGKKLHEQEGINEVRSRSSQKCWVWDWDKNIWFLDTSRDRRYTKSATMNSRELGDTEMGDEANGLGLELSDTNDETSDSEALSQTKEPEALLDSRLRTSKRKRDNKNAERGPTAKRSRESDPEAPMDKSKCHHQCTDWCFRGYDDQEASYAEAWQNFVGMQHDQSASVDKRFI